ncbi:hypothetical protein JTE90_010574, partial [Oedothorax gibbosus]
VTKKRLRVRLRYRTCPEGTYPPCPGWEILTHSLSSAARQHEHVFAFRQTSRFGTDFSDPLGPTDPCFNCCSHGTLLQLQSSRLSLEYLLLPTKICTGGGSRRAHARHLQRTPPATPPTHCGVNLHEGSSRRSGPVCKGGLLPLLKFEKGLNRFGPKASNHSFLPDETEQ